MLSDFAEKKETTFTIKKTEFFKVQIIIFFFQRVDQKMPNFSLFRFGQNKTRNNA